MAGSEDETLMTGISGVEAVSEALIEVLGLSGVLWTTVSLTGVD